MRYLFTLLCILGPVGFGFAQTFEWNSKSAEGSAVKPRSESTLAYERAFNERQRGYAGIYNPNLTGTRTIYGETYNPRELTASHAVLPLGTLIRVTNLDNGRGVTARVNDRGKECGDCLVTLSEIAAEQIGINFRGRVTVERVGFSNWNPAPPKTPAPAPAPYTYSQPTAYSSPATVAPARNPGVVRPVTIEGESYGWEAKSNEVVAPNAYGSSPAAPTTYYGNGNPTVSSEPRPYNPPSPTTANFTTLSPKGVDLQSREVQPTSTPTNYAQPATYSRYPSSPTNYQETPTVATLSPPVPTVANTSQEVQPQLANQAPPPPSTVRYYQAAKSAPAPATYANTPAAPVAYSAPAPAPAPVMANNAAYVVQLGAYNNELYAQNRVTQLQQAGLTNVFYRSITKPDGQVINRVYSGTFSTMAEAQSASSNIRNQHNIAGIVTRM
jgi:rare lipoprotein A (peptidoglycan hydrolase)/cell division protein FtsN